MTKSCINPSEFLATLSTGSNATKAVVEIERKYLLSGLPPLAKSAPKVEIEQGYIPGTQIHERVRKVTAASGQQYFRTIKIGKGLSRIELEDETTQEIFAVLWPLTNERRVSKRRYTIKAQEFFWEIDEFLDRPLVLAEIELPSTESQIIIPNWLEKWIVREVTDEAGFQNINLAR